MPRPVRVETRKWPDSPHWEFEGLLLGADAHGTWIGVPQGTLLASPARAFHAAADHVTLAPHAGWWMGTFYGADLQRPFDVYVDISTEPVWHGDGLVRAIDLDLDVIRGTTGRVWVDDEDEFAAHRVELGYPDAVAAAAIGSCEAVLDAVRRGAPPFDGTAGEWLARLRHALAV